MYGKFLTSDKNTEIMIEIDCKRVRFFVRNRDLSSRLDFFIKYTTCEEAHKAFIDVMTINDVQLMHEKIISMWLYKEYDVQSPSKYYANFAKEFADNFHKGVAMANKDVEEKLKSLLDELNELKKGNDIS